MKGGAKSTFRKGGAKLYYTLGILHIRETIFAPLFLKVEKVEKVEKVD